MKWLLIVSVVWSAGMGGTTQTYGVASLDACRTEALALKARLNTFGVASLTMLCQERPGLAALEEPQRSLKTTGKAVEAQSGSKVLARLEIPPPPPRAKPAAPRTKLKAKAPRRAGCWKRYRVVGGRRHWYCRART